MGIQKKSVRLPNPDLQIDFSACLAAARKSYLLDALCAVVGSLDIAELDHELARMVPQSQLRAVASAGLRGELVFPVPIVLKANPRLLSYYRLLLGHSQKVFYQGRYGATHFKCMEDAGVLPRAYKVETLCRELIRGLNLLVTGIGVKQLRRELLDDLTLLTLGPQLRGGANVKKGSASIRAVFEIIHAIVRKSLKSASEKRLVLKNAAGRRVTIQFASDPDIVIQESISKDASRNIIAIEIKGGTDFSNIHNRIGEAEKSHQKARLAGYVECWTIVNVHQFDELKAKSESPSTNRFFRLSELVQARGAEYTDFKSRVIALAGLSEKKA